MRASRPGVARARSALRTGVSLVALAALGALPSTGDDGRAIPSDPERIEIAPAAWQPPSPEDHEIVLSGGGRLFVATDSSMPLIEIVVGLRGGAFLDPPERPGLGRLAVEMIERGGTESLTPVDFERRLDALGARISARFSPAFAVFGLSATRWDLDPAVDLFAEALRRPRFDAGRLEVLVSELREGMARRNDDPLEVLRREWEWLLYGADHRATRPLVPRDLAGIDAPALRRHHRAAWRTQEVVIAVSGDVGRDEAKAIAERLAAPPEGAAATRDALPWPPPAPGPGTDGGAFRIPRDLEQAKVMLGHRLTGEAAVGAERWPLRVLAEVLGGSGAVARIQGRLRAAEGLVYRSSVALEVGDLWPGEIQVFFETRPENVPRALDLVLDELDRARQRPVPERELEAAKRNLLARLRLRFDTADEVAGYLAENALHGRADDHWTAYAHGVAAVTPADVLRVARTHLRLDGLTVLVLGPVPEDDALPAIVGHPVTVLPERDPSSLRPLGRPVAR